MSSTSEFARSSGSRGESLSTKGRAASPDKPPDDKTPPEPTGGDAAERRRLEREILLVSDREQRRIGADLHDGLGAHLTGVSLLVRGLARDLRHGRSIDPKQMDEIARLLAEGIEQVQSLAHRLHPFILAVRGLTVALADLASSTEKQSGITCTFEETGEDGDGRDADDVTLTTEQAMHLYRIAQEAVANAVRHANATRILITLSRRERRCHLAVVDNGIGYEPGRPADENVEMGLSIMRYRADMIGARLDISGSPEQGTTVSCTFQVST